MQASTYALNPGAAAATVALLGAFAALVTHVALLEGGEQQRERVAKATVAAGLGLGAVAVAPFALRRVSLDDWA